MTLHELVQAMRTDLGDEDGALFTDPALTRCVVRALYSAGQETGRPLQMVDGEIAPCPEGALAEGVLLLAESYACAIMRGKTANAVNVTSGDKRIERTTQAKYWGDLEADLLARYRRHVTEMTGGDVFIIPPPWRPVLYEQGGEVIAHELCE